MKKTTTVLMMMTMFISFSQKKANGTIYDKHPAIDVVNAYTTAMNAGDISKAGDFLSSDFKGYFSTDAKPSDKAVEKDDYVKGMKSWRDGIEYFSIATSKGSYPDAIEYKDDNQKNVVWVQTWDEIKGMNKATGVKMNMFIHQLYTVNKDNKINMIIMYDNPMVGYEINASRSERTNGTIYNHHENINNLRKMLGAYENNDLAKAYTYYDKDAQLYDVNSTDRKAMTLDQMKTNDAKFYKDFEVVEIEQVGYPDYMHYEMGDSGVTYSWWNYQVIRKSDKKAITVPVHLQDTFNKEGKIISESVYYNAGLFK